MSRIFIAAFAALALVASANIVLDAPPVKGAHAVRDDVDSLDDLFVVGARPAYDMKQFINKKVFVTGGSSGIGFGTALLFARFGADVTICSRDSNPKWFTGQQAVDRISNDTIVKENNGKIRWVKCDVSDKAGMIKLFQQFDDEKYIIDYAVNDAAIIGAVGDMNTVIPYYGGKFDAVYNNLIGTVNSLEVEIAMFQKYKKDAAIVNLASVNGYRASAGALGYAASKFGVLGLTRATGVEYARGSPMIRINAIAPGFTNTSLVWQQTKLMAGIAHQVWEEPYVTPDSDLWQKYKDVLISMCPNGDISDPLDQANMIAFLLAKESALITGSIFVVDGVLGE